LGPIENRLQELAQIFSGAVAGFSVLDNHLHVLVRLDSEIANGWSDEEVVLWWGRLFPPRDKSRQPSPVSNDWVEWRMKDAGWVAKARERLQSLSWFMKCLREPLSRLANREESARGAFFEGRFKSVAILDEESVLATCAFIDLNPVAPGIAEVPEASEHTSIKERVDHVKSQGRTEDLKAARTGSVAGSNERSRRAPGPAPRAEPGRMRSVVRLARSSCREPIRALVGGFPAPFAGTDVWSRRRQREL